MAVRSGRGSAQGGSEHVSVHALLSFCVCSLNKTVTVPNVSPTSSFALRVSYFAELKTLLTAVRHLVVLYRDVTLWGRLCSSYCLDWNDHIWNIDNSVFGLHTDLFCASRFT